MSRVSVGSKGEGKEWKEGIYVHRDGAVRPGQQGGWGPKVLKERGCCVSRVFGG